MAEWGPKLETWYHAQQEREEKAFKEQIDRDRESKVKAELEQQAVAGRRLIL